MIKGKFNIDLPKIYIDDIMRILSMIELPEDLDDVVYKFIIYMHQNKRFKYSKIADHIYSLLNNEEDAIYFMDENIKSIKFYSIKNEEKIKSIIDNINNTTINYDKFTENLEKVDDYISLEIHRIQFNKRNEISTRTEFIDDLNRNIRNVTDETTEAIKRTEGGIYTTVISVLGIFAAFIASYFGGLNTFASIMSNLDGVSKFRLVFIVLLLGIILFNITFVLLWFISKMLKKNMGGKVPFSDISDYENLKLYKRTREYKYIKRLLKKFKELETMRKKKKILKAVHKFNKMYWIRRVYLYHKIKFKRFPMIYVFNIFCMIGMIGTILLKYLDFNNIFKF